jgi:acetyl esterase/lipase
VDISCSNPEIAGYEDVDPTLSPAGLKLMGKAWAGSAWTDDPAKMDYRLSPMNGDVSGLRDVYIFVGTREIFYPDDCAFAEKLKAAGVDTTLVVGEGLNHVWLASLDVPEATLAQEQVAEIITK